MFCFLGEDARICTYNVWPSHRLFTLQTFKVRVQVLSVFFFSLCFYSPFDVILVWRKYTLYNFSNNISSELLWEKTRRYTANIIIVKDAPFIHVLVSESGISELEKVVFLVEIDFFFLFEIEKAPVTTYVFLFRKF